MWQEADFPPSMIAIFDEDGGGDVDFQEFVSGLSAFSSKGNKEEKLRFAFKVYDIDRDGYISNGELFIVLKMMVGSNLKDMQLQQIVDKTIMEADKDRDGKISFEEFANMVENTDVTLSMTLGTPKIPLHLVLVHIIGLLSSLFLMLCYCGIQSQAWHLDCPKTNHLFRSILSAVPGPLGTIINHQYSKCFLAGCIHVLLHNCVLIEYTSLTSPHLIHWETTESLLC